MLCCDPPDAEAAGEVSRLILARLAGFSRTLRDNGFTIGLKESEDAARLLQSDIGRRPAALRSAFKALFSTRRTDWLRFDDIFNAYWLGRGANRRLRIGGTAAAAKSPSLRQLAEPGARSGAPGLGDQLPRDDGEGESEAADGRGRMEGASRIESLAETDFRKIADPAALQEAHSLAERLARRMQARLTRRQRVRSRGRRIDFRRTIRRNIAHGGIPIELVRRDRKPKPLRLVVLLDASGSMNLYTSVFVRFVHGVLDHFQEAEAFLFHTRLVHVSSAMRERDAARALERLSLMAEGVGGGTRIGESLATFNRWHAKRVVNSRTCVMIVSDGYDTGEPEALAREMQQLGRRCRRIVWLNPMIGWDGYAPEARGMRAALPHIDLFAPAHNLKSLAALEPYLARL